MLTLQTRHAANAYDDNDKIVLDFADGRRIVVQCVELVNGRAARIGVDADRGVAIYRGPVFARAFPGEPIESRPPRQIAALPAA
jgi:hypothetical protein